MYTQLSGDSDYVEFFAVILPNDLKLSFSWNHKNKRVFSEV